MSYEPLTPEQLEAWSQSVVQEIWNEMGRRRITSLSELGRLAGMTPQYVTARLKVDPKTKKPVTITVKDLAAFGSALDEDPGVFLARAQDAMNRGDAPVIHGAFGEPSEATPNLDHLRDQRGAAAPKRRDTGQGEDDA